MKKATTIEEVFQVFAPEEVLTIDDIDFYVDLFGLDFKRFVVALQTNQVISKTYFIAGQSGNGKSSVLNLLTKTYPKIDDKYDFIHIPGRKVFLYEDIDIVDILLIIGFKLTEANDALKPKFLEELKKLEALNQGLLEESSTQIDTEKRDRTAKVYLKAGARFFGFLNAGADLESSYKVNEEIRTDARRFFKIQRKALIDLINGIIQAYKRQNEVPQDVAIIIDDLEKKDNVDDLFIKDIPLLNELKAVKIITMPIHLKRTQTFSAYDTREFGLKVKTRGGEPHRTDMDLLKEVVRKRLDDAALIDEAAIDLAVEYCGGNVRQLIRLVHLAAEEAIVFEGTRITQGEMQTAVGRLERDFSNQVMLMKSFLGGIAEHKNCDDDDDNLAKLAKATRQELVFAYFNGHVWYDLNPVAVKPLQLYQR